MHLDHAASTLIAQSIRTSVMQNWMQHSYANPRMILIILIFLKDSQSNCALLTSKKIADTRQFVLKELFHTNAAQYDIIFTSNATHAMKMVGEMFTFTEQSTFCYLAQSHNSLLGIREYAVYRGAKFLCLQEDQIIQGSCCTSSDASCNLFAYSPECNFSGSKFPLEWIKQVQNGKLGNGTWYTLLDAAKFCSTNELDLSQYYADFIAVSFYKIFGMPTGLGALLVNKRANSVLKKRYFSGGTVLASAADVQYHILRTSLHEQLEDGTNNFLDICVLQDIIQTWKKLIGPYGGQIGVSQHTYFLSHHVYEQLCNLKHYNGTPIAEYYGNHHLNTISKQVSAIHCSSLQKGSILNLNFLRADGSYVGYSEVSQFASLHNIELRVSKFFAILIV